MDTPKQAPSNRWPFPRPNEAQEKPQPDKGLDTERVDGRTPGTEPSKEKRSDDN